MEKLIRDTLTTLQRRAVSAFQHLNAATRQGGRAMLLIALVPMMLAACSEKRITKANVDQITENMSKKQVESILGPPSEIDNKDFLIMKKTTYVYRQGKETANIVFKDDKVVEKQSSLSD